MFDDNSLSDGDIGGIIIVLFIAAMLVCWIFGGFFVDEDRVMSAIGANTGLEDIGIMEEWRLMPVVGGCGYADAAGFEISAMREGEPIKALVCTGWWFKGATLRYMW